MKQKLLVVLPAIVVAVLYVLLLGRDQSAALRKAQADIRALGTVEEHEVGLLQAQAQLRSARAELDALRAVPPPAQAHRPSRSASAALSEAHKRISAHPGARILGAFRSDVAGPQGSDKQAEAAALLRELGGGDIRAWSVSLEAPWTSLHGILDDFAAPTNGAPALVQSLSMLPAVGDGKPNCWSFTICQ